jgi:hypothetical protein
MSPTGIVSIFRLMPFKSMVPGFAKGVPIFPSGQSVCLWQTVFFYTFKYYGPICAILCNLCKFVQICASLMESWELSGR